MARGPGDAARAASSAQGGHRLGAVRRRAGARLRPHLHQGARPLEGARHRQRRQGGGQGGRRSELARSAIQEGLTPARTDEHCRTGIDPRPPRRIYRWDLDKTYLQTEFDTLPRAGAHRVQKAHEKEAVPGAAALIRELRGARATRGCASSPAAPRRCARCSRRSSSSTASSGTSSSSRTTCATCCGAASGPCAGRWATSCRSCSRAAPARRVEAEEVLFGDDAEADAFIYSLYADLVAGRVDERGARPGARGAREVYPDDARARASRVAGASPARTRCGASSSTSIGSPRRRTSRATARAWCPSSTTSRPRWCCWPTAHLTAPQVVQVAVEMVQTAGLQPPHPVATPSRTCCAAGCRSRRSRRGAHPRRSRGPTALLQASGRCRTSSPRSPSGWRRWARRLRLRRRGPSTT